MRSNRNTVRLLSALSLASISAACAPRSAPPASVGIVVPATLLHCKGEPAVPEPDRATDVDLARWQLDLIAAGCDCRDKLAAIRALQAGTKPPATTCTVR